MFQRMSDTDVPVTDVLRGIDAAIRVGFRPVKVNAVIQRGVNEGGVVDLARRFQGTGVVVRFIEYMDVGSTNRWALRDVVPAREIVERIDRVAPLEPVTPSNPGEVARRYRYRDGSGEIGVISSVTQPFCGDCTRGRLSADGHLYTCLFATQGTDLRPILRTSPSDGDAPLRDIVAKVWTGREDRYSELRATAATAPKIEMSYIGG
jgi:cyclic pyranopterin phosphate synthase